ncbi:MAG: response regulator, partial [Ignavibacteriales bacterium]
SHLVDIKQKDELGALARSFNTMVVKVRDSQLELESKIKNRTAELRKANENLEELNEKLKELDKLKTNFFTNVSHELRTPLALIMGPVEKLLSQKDLSKNEEKDLRIIQQNARILLKQVNNLLDLSKLEVGKMELEYSDLDLANLVRVIASYFEAMAIEKKITLKVSLPDTLPVQADADKIERVLINLLSNAFKFTPENGRIECGLSLDNSAVTFFVKDSGPGVKPEFQKEIFVKYKKADKGLIRHLGSTGLGLSIVKEFIELHKGSIRVKNNEKAGATFSFKIPVNAPAGTILHGRMIINETEIKDVVESYEILRRDNNNKKLIYNLKPSEKLLPIKGLPTILVIEDNHDMNSFICQTLSSSFNVISAYDGEDGYAKAVKNKPDLIITDIMMPRLSGDMVVSKIKANPDMETIPIIVLSAKSDEDLKIELLRQGVQDYLNKPFTIEELKARVNNIIKMKLVKDRLQSELKSHSEDLSTLVEELSERKNLIELSLLEKEVLLKEIHHRVKNNLQVISSLLNLQSNSINDPESFEIFRESQNRIKSMALIHEKLYKSKNLLQINLEEYINDLISNVYQSYFGGSNHLPLKLKVKDIFLSVDTAISIGLIINELISNALKHAFNDNEVPNGEIEVHLNNEVQNIYCLIVKDNGRGIPDNFNYKDPKTLGLRLVNSLVHQLDGE